MTESPFLTKTEAMAYLKVGRKRFLHWQLEGRLHLNPDTGLLARSEVEHVAREELAKIVGNETTLGPQEQPVGSLAGFRRKATLV
ncbi:MAG: hypothetical protein JSS66_14650 [Armatimonadetes bacterium]|nr:hypothetical protein [Armatimonadota bacterium]